MTTNGDIISRIKNLVKGVKQDAFLTDRFVYSLILKHARFLMKRMDGQSKLSRFNSIWQPLEFVELEEVDKVRAGCAGLKSDCTIKRTKEKLPAFMEGYWGPLIRTVMSVDGSEAMQPTFPLTYINISKQKNFKYNTTKYYWYIDGYLYFPNLEWDAVMLEGVFEEDISLFNCKCKDACVQKQLQRFNVPDYLFPELEAKVMQDLGMNINIPSDNNNNNQNILR